MLEKTQWVLVLLLAYTVVVVRLIAVLPVFHRSQKVVYHSAHTEPSEVHVFVFLGSGGHTGEMLQLMQNYGEVFSSKRTVLHVGYSDVASRRKFEQMPKEATVHHYRFVKAREVGAGLFSSVKSIFTSLVQSLWNIIIIRLWYMRGKPHLVLLNGPGTCCIITTWFKLLEWICLGLRSSNIIYVESMARIKELSLTGKILYYMADQFVVQWDDLLQRYPDAKYYGILV